MLALMLTHLEDRDDPRVVEVGGRLGLDVEAFDIGLGGELAGEDHLQRDGAVEANLPRPVDDAHAAPGDLLEQLVVAEVADGLGPISRRRGGRRSVERGSVAVIAIDCRLVRGRAAPGRRWSVLRRRRSVRAGSRRDPRFPGHDTTPIW